jgi:DNA-binding YbaB/EbfC family protein
MSLPDLGQLLGKAQQMQAKLAELKRDLARRRYEGSAGGGMVVAVATGELRVLEVTIEPKLVESGDRDMIQDLCAAAVNAALANAQQGAQEEMQRLTSSLGLPDLASLGPLNPFGTGGA